MCKYVLKKLSFVIRYVPGQYKTQQMCDKTIKENGRRLEFIPDCFKTQKICNKIVDKYPQKMCGKAVNTHPSTRQFVPKCYMTLEMYDKGVNRCLLYLLLFLIGIKLKKCVIELLLKIIYDSIFPQFMQKSNNV